MLTRLIPKMSDVFAAFSTGGAGWWDEDQLDNPPMGINASLYSIVGSEDKKIADGTGHPLPFPVLAEEIVADPLFSGMFTSVTTILSLEPAYQARTDIPWFTTLTYNKSLTGANNQFIFRMVSRMGHVYPSGDNNRAGLNASDLFWEFFTQYTQASVN